MNRTFLFKATAVATLSIAAVAATSSTAAAQTGSRVNITGSALVGNQPGSEGANLLIDFLAGSPEPTLAGTPTGTVNATQVINGVFVAPGGITSGVRGTIQDLAASSSGFVGLPVANFMTLGGYTFSLANAPSGNSFGPISLFDTGTGTAATFGVNGVVTGPGLSDPYFYTGVFTAQFAGRSPSQVFSDINDGTNLPVGFSAEFTIGANSVVPEPSTYALLATGMGALGVVARRRRQQA